MVAIFLILLFFVTIVRFFASKRNASDAKRYYLTSALVQSLMFSSTIVGLIRIDAKSSILGLSMPIENRSGIYVSTFIAFLLMLGSINIKRNYSSYSLSLPVLLTIICLYSLVNPYNCSINSTFIAIVVLLQILFITQICKRYVGERLLFTSIYDAFRIIVSIEFLISFTYVIMGSDLLQGLFFYDVDEIEYLREGTSYRRAYGTTFQPNRLGCLCALITIHFYSCFMFKHKAKQSLVWALISFSTICLSQSRSSIIGTIFSLCFIQLIYSYKRKQLMTNSLIGYSFFLGLVLFLLGNMDYFQNMFFKSDANQMQAARFSHYLVAWNIFQTHPLIGVGLNAHTQYMYYYIQGNYSNWILSHPIHCLHLLIIAELGIIGFVVWLYYLLSRIIKICKTNIFRWNNPISAYSFLGILLLMIVHGFSDIVYIHYQYLLIISLIGISFGIEKGKGRRVYP